LRRREIRAKCKKINAAERLLLTQISTMFIEEEYFAKRRRCNIKKLLAYNDYRRAY
jgi:hypothetical protein